MIDETRPMKKWPCKCGWKVWSASYNASMEQHKQSNNAKPSRLKLPCSAPLRANRSNFSFFLSHETKGSSMPLTTLTALLCPQIQTFLTQSNRISSLIQTNELFWHPPGLNKSQSLRSMPSWNYREYSEQDSNTAVKLVLFQLIGLKPKKNGNCWA